MFKKRSEERRAGRVMNSIILSTWMHIDVIYQCDSVLMPIICTYAILSLCLGKEGGECRRFSSRSGNAGLPPGKRNKHSRFGIQAGRTCVSTY